MSAGTHVTIYQGKAVVVCNRHPDTILSRGSRNGTDVVVGCVYCEREWKQYSEACAAWGLVGRLAARDLMSNWLLDHAGRTADPAWWPMRRAMNVIMAGQNGGLRG